MALRRWCPLVKSCCPYRRHLRFLEVVSSPKPAASGDKRDRDGTMNTVDEQLRIANEAAGVGFARLATDERFEDVNNAYCQVLRRSREELIGKDWRTSIHPDDHRCAQAAFDSARNRVPGYV